uniref:Netrin axonal chemotropic factor n=1 Tax=Lutzomyia longipalpis TaxID=7200 RepID=A0A1B0CH53_LUTLO
MGMGSIVVALMIAALVVPAIVNGAELTPPYFNLAEGRKIYSTSTCGVDTDGPELYCKLVGANTENDHNYYSLIQGQVCDYCDPTNPEKSHPPAYAIDGTENWWQSPPLSRGMKYNEVNLTIDFGQEFHVAYLFIRMGNSPRPGLWTLEKSTDYGQTWKPWQHFSDTPADCETYFGRDSLKPITEDDDVICTTEYSKIVPLENGEIPVTLLNNRPSANNYFNSTVLQEWTRATNVRIRLLRTKNLLGHLMSVARQDPTVTRRYFYSIKDISIGGRCMCNGHADTCHILDPSSPNRLLACQCRHNTCGIHCNECCPGYEQKKWRQNTNARPFQCEPCNCFGHSGTCVYDEEIDEKALSLDIHGHYEGGGKCLHCQHNTEGINCNKCKDTFYRPYGKHWNETDVCHPCNCNYHYATGNCEEGTGRCECRKEFQPPNCDACSYGHFGYPDCRPCTCNLNGTEGYYCEPHHGTCPCKANFAGQFCEKCAEGYYNFPECTPCECFPLGSQNLICKEDGQCPCNSNFAGKHCDKCKDGYYEFPSCLYCDCDIRGTVEEVCEKDGGQCICREGFAGTRCDRCLHGYYNYPDCVPCNCSTMGSQSPYCDLTGKCPCITNFAGRTCSSCAAGYYNYPECLRCNCDIHGSDGRSCNAEGQCNCLNNFDGKTCNQCKEGFYNFPACEECNCDPAGVIPQFAGCGSVPAGELCQCKKRVTGRICDVCKPLYWNLNVSNAEGCEECNCFVDGTIGALDTCDTKTGQCPCKPTVRGRTCNVCKDGTFDLHAGSLFGCQDCGCDIGGSINGVCEKSSGQCLCHPRITGRTCNQPLTTHFFPTLYQYQYEYEDGKGPHDEFVRYQYDESIFPDFSKKAYAVFSSLQTEIWNEVHIFKSSVYRIVIRYVNPSDKNIIGLITITSENPSEVDQTAKVLFKPTASPQFVTVSGSRGEIPAPVVLDPGHYIIKTSISDIIFLDYFVLLPAAYYEASILTKKIENPCEFTDLSLCSHYNYPSIAQFFPVYQSYPEDPSSVSTVILYSDIEHLSYLNEDQIPVLNGYQPKLHYDLTVNRTGKYIIVVDYITGRDYVEPELTSVKMLKDDDDGILTYYPCPYTTPCRQPVIDAESREKIIFLEANATRTLVLNAGRKDIGVKSVAVIPWDTWSLDYVTPSQVCVMRDGACVRGSFRTAPDSKKIEFEFDRDDLVAEHLPRNMYDNNTKLIHLNPDQSSIEIKSKVPSPGRYVILVKFYQPNYSTFNINYRLDADRQMHEGKFPVRHCPSNIGCRELIKGEGEYIWFDIEDSFTLTLTNVHRDRDVWLDFILVVPADQFKEYLLTQETFDQTKEFIQYCGQDHFHIHLNASDFCKKAVFSLTADYNHGALPCACDIDGSTSLECDPFGGQCQCGPHITGRQCDTCRLGYYGFPHCKPCNCPISAQCHTVTGACICPRNIIGDQCDKCAPYAYGFDQVSGCFDCHCDPHGVINGNLQCDINNGSCSCKPHVVNRACDKCENGFFNFPNCYPCNCDVRGTTFEICDQTDESCFCKKHVVGPNCRDCEEGTYNLQASNPDGCTKCFCFGKTTRCESAFLRPLNISIFKDVSIASIAVAPEDVYIYPLPTNEPHVLIDAQRLEIQVDFSNLQTDELGVVYFGMIDRLVGQDNHLTAYGGYLSYSILYTTGLYGSAIIAPDVILKGKDQTLVHQSYEQPANAHVFRGSVKMVESNFRTTSGAPVTREQFMTLLKCLEMIYIRGTYWDGTKVSRLSDVALTMADADLEHYNLYEDLAVEKCYCPAGYQGLSCEDCAPGYYRDPNGPHGGYCIPCQCNGHAKTCDYNTGVCHECLHSTTGDHCEMCIEGYYGNATYGTPYDCMICACPMPIEGNNFATSCEVSEDGYQIHCECKQGYTGARCESCAAGFFGEPEKEGHFCRPCECSGNIDPSMPGSCDSVNGECLLCLNNTFGSACNLCAPGFYGDAIDLKDCQSCICDQMGTEFCDSYVGTCHCLRNVIGDKCDRCADDHYGFDSGLGCKPCDCGVSSESTQCDDHTGDCRCKPGVTGRQCDRCLPGYWNYTAEGCLPCSCNTDYSRGLGCNALTGQCECLPGVVGEKCDACPYRWVLIPDTGCQQCDHCHHALLDVTDSLKSFLDPVVLEFDTIAGGYFTAQKLNYFDEMADKIQPEVLALDPKGVNLNPIVNAIEDLEQETKNAERRISYAEQNADDLQGKEKDLQKKANEVLNETRQTGQNTQRTVNEVQKLANSFLDATEETNIDGVTDEAKKLLERIVEYNVDLEPAREQLDLSRLQLRHIEVTNLPATLQQLQMQNLQNATLDFQDRLTDVFKLGTAAKEKALMARRLNDKNNQAKINSKFETLAEQTKEARKHLQEGRHILQNASNVINGIIENTREIDKANYELKDMNKLVDTILPARDADYRNRTEKLKNAAIHAQNLRLTSQDLQEQMSNIEANSGPAIRAATAYATIVNTTNDAKRAVREAIMAAGNATELTNGIEDRAGHSDQVARDLLVNAQKALNEVKVDLEPRLNKSVEAVQRIQSINQNSDDQATAINLSLDSIIGAPKTKELEEAKEASDAANKKAQNSLKILKPIVKALPDDLVRAQELPKEVDKTSKDITQISNQVDQVKTIVPNLEHLVEELEQKQNATNLISSDLGDRIGKLRKQVEMARDLANSIKVGVNFHPNTTLELKTPPNLPLLASNTKMSLFFKTDKPDGFLVYLGNEQGTEQNRPKHNDFMALEIENGYPALTMDLGYGPEKIINRKFVADGQWHEAIIDRTGNNVQLTIREEVEGGAEKLHTVNETLPGPYSVFDVDKDSRLFVGGYPPDFVPQPGLVANSFEGQIEDLKIGDQNVGLWNFVDAQDNYHGAKERDKLVSKDAPTTGFRFNGNGYVILDSKPYSLKSRSSIMFNFKASRDTKDGLMFYAGKHRHFIAVELKNGEVHFQFKLGQHTVSMLTTDKFNDNDWHHVEAVREGRKGVLKVDHKEMYEEETYEGSEDLKISDSMYFGGYPGKLNHSEVTSQGFDGCIDQVHIAGSPVDLSRNLKAYGVRPGCPDKFSSSLTFKPNEPGYLRRGNVSSDNFFQVNLKFKTKQEEGVIFYAANHDQSSNIGLVLHDGHLILTSNRESVVGRALNDGEWHIVTATHDSQSLRLDIDDESHYGTDAPAPLLQISFGDIFFGGLPRNFRLPKNSLKTTAYFVGCITDVTINGDVVNFAESTDRTNAVLADCHPDLLNYDLWKVPHHYPDEGAPPVPEVPAVPSRFQPDDAVNEIDLEEEPTEKETSAPPVHVHYTTAKPTTTSTTTTTTTQRPFRRPDTPAPPPQTDCRLPAEPEWDVDFEAGYRFGTGLNTRVEYLQMPTKPKRAYDFSLQFKTTDPDGVLFYAADSRHTDFIALYLQKGRLHHIFKGGAATVNMSSQYEYHNNEWHTVLFSRSHNKGKLIVDDDDISGGEASDQLRAMSVHPPYYLGGLSPQVVEDSYINLKLEKGKYFRGCIRNFQAAGRSVGDPAKLEGVIPCSEQVEQGHYFGGGFVKLRERFRVGSDMTISLDIKPRTQDGLLLSVHGRRAFMIVQLVKGNISFVVDNGDGPFEAVFNPEPNENFCDGEWRTVTVVKSKFVITIKVNKINSKPQIGPTKTPSADTTRPLFLGGHPYLHKV